MDEQVLRARLAALDQANQALNYSGMIYGADVADIGPAVTQVAAAFEKWLLRPAPIDVSDLNNPFAPRPSCDAETVADRIGYPRCSTVWRKADARLHRCIYIPDHDSDRCKCACGDRPTT